MEHARTRDHGAGRYQWMDAELYLLLHEIDGKPLDYRFKKSGTAFGTYDEVVTLMNKQGMPSFVAVKLSCIKAVRV